MQLSVKAKETAVTIICLLYILLFVYAALNKVLDFENFRVQLGQSPLLSAYAGTVSWSIPALELILAVLIATRKYRFVGLLAALGLMVGFCTYIIILLNWATFVPCSCGGILEKMGWTEHLVFNFVFVFLACFALLVEYTLRRGENPKGIYRRTYFITLLLSSVTVGAALVLALYSSSEYKMHNDNSFIRAFTYQPQEDRRIDLKFNSYYLAGIVGNDIYLGNYTAPLVVASLDLSLSKLRTFPVSVSHRYNSLEAAQLRVMDNNFYLINPRVPVIYKGKINDWKAKLLWKGNIPFLKFAMIDSCHVASSYISRKTWETSLGIFNITDDRPVEEHSELLKRQEDGIFDVDGSITYNLDSQKLVYLYYYRNQYLITGSALNLLQESRTIDTNSHAKIKIAELKGRAEKKMVAPPYSVNGTIATYGNLLFVQSLVAGRYEPLDMWDVASVIDIYELEGGKYLSSFYIYNIGVEKMKSFCVLGDHFYAIVGNHIVSYALNREIIRYNL